MKRLSIDIETYSPTDLASAGVYRYAEDGGFRVLLFGYSVDDDPVVRVIDLAHGEELPGEIRAALTDPSVEKWAFNSNFERVCLSRFLGLPVGSYLPPEEWRCSMTWCATLGLPTSLAEAGRVLALDTQKDMAGKRLIKRFSTGIYSIPSKEDPDWQRFVDYNAQDVRVENAIRRRLARWPVPEKTWKEFAVSEEINDRGIGVDLRLIRNAIALSEEAAGELLEEMRRLTGLENPNSPVQLKAWLREHGIEVLSLGKEEVNSLLEQCTDEEVKAVLRLRLRAAKTSVKKYEAMLASVNADGRVRGMFAFYGASRTGRFASKRIQLQNLPKNTLSNLDEARELVLKGRLEDLKAAFPDVPDTLSQLIRTAFVPQKGRQLLVADESAIEARLLAAIAGEGWRVRAFEAGQDIYCASASRMFHCNVEKHGENAHLRPKGKVAELALGYGGSVGALKAMGALSMGLTEEELPGIVYAWREASPQIVKFWWAVDEAAKNAVLYRAETHAQGFTFSYESPFLFITLYSGRRLAYLYPRIGQNRFGGDCLTYEGTGPDRKPCRLETYGPKLVENIIQATARDVLCEALTALRDKEPVLHVHDEIVLDCGDKCTLSELEETMGRSPLWYPSLLLRADGYETPFYKKD